MNEFEMVEGLTALEQRQLTLAHMVKMVARKISHALFVFGSQGGLGKSRTILRTLDDEGITPIIINSHVTPLSLYGTLFQHRQEAILFSTTWTACFRRWPTWGCCEVHCGDRHGS